MNKIKIPKILQIKGVHPQDCITFGTIFDVDRLLISNDVKDADESLPSIFQDKSAWVKSTNTKCMNCTLNFDSVPVPCPLLMQRKKNGEDIMFTLKKNKNNKVIVFCSFECLINNTYEIIHNESDRIMTLKLIELLAISFGVHGKSIKRGLSREDIDLFGGAWNVKKFKNQITPIYWHE
jgi:hypothetical protein